MLKLFVFVLAVSQVLSQGGIHGQVANMYSQMGDNLSRQYGFQGNSLQDRYGGDYGDRFVGDGDSRRDDRRDDSDDNDDSNIAYDVLPPGADDDSRRNRNYGGRSNYDIRRYNSQRRYGQYLQQRFWGTGRNFRRYFGY